MNCFQNCTFTYDSQRELSSEYWTPGCELLSKLYFYLWFPTFNYWCLQSIGLWIAFKIVLLLMIPNWVTQTWVTQTVVNCFQNCTFTYDSQPFSETTVGKIGCELLSKLYFYLWFPTYSLKRCSSAGLWIAFKIVLLLMIPNI